MKIGVLFDGTIKNPGGYNQSLLSSIYLSKLKFNKLDLKLLHLKNFFKFGNKSQYFIISTKYNFKIINFLFKVIFFLKFLPFCGSNTLSQIF